MSKEKKVCPLSLNEWVNYLMQQQNIEYFKFYNEVVSNFTILIVLLTLLSGVLVFMEILYNLISLDIITKYVSMGVTLAIFFVIIGIIIYAIKVKIPKSKNEMKRITKSEANLIDDILRSNEVNPECILKRYSDIWRNK